MDIKSFRHEGVNPDGTLKNGHGAVDTEGKIIMSEDNGGCGLDSCNCSGGHWISIIKPRTEAGVVEGVNVSFDSQAEMNKFFINREIIGS